MMAFTVRWGRPDAGRDIKVETVEDLRAALDKAAVDADLIPLVVRIEAVDTKRSVELVIGHTVRAALAYIDRGSGVRLHAVQPDVQPLAWWIQVNDEDTFRGFSPYWTRLHPALVRQAAEEFVRTSERPPCIPEWLNNPL